MGYFYSECVWSTSDPCMHGQACTTWYMGSKGYDTGFVCLLSVCYLIFYLQWQPAEEKVIPTNLMLQWLNYEIVLERCAYIALELRLLYQPGRYRYRSQCVIRHTWSQLSQSDGILHLP